MPTLDERLQAIKDIEAQMLGDKRELALIPSKQRELREHLAELRKQRDDLTVELRKQLPAGIVRTRKRKATTTAQ